MVSFFGREGMGRGAKGNHAPAIPAPFVYPVIPEPPEVVTGVSSVTFMILRGNVRLPEVMKADVTHRVVSQKSGRDAD